MNNIIELKIGGVKMSINNEILAKLKEELWKQFPLVEVERILSILQEALQ